MSRYAGTVVLTLKTQRPQSIAGRLWNLAQNMSAIAELAFIGLKRAGVIDWSWWWVLSPLWINGILLAALVGAVLVPHFRPRRRAG
jgi:hypothetical protein